MTIDEKVIAVKSMDSVNAINALNSVGEYKNDQSSEKLKLVEEDVKAREKNEQQIKEPKENQLEEIEKTKEEIEFNNRINEFLKANIQRYLENNKQFEGLDINAEDLYSLLPPELKELVEIDFNLEQQKEFKKEEHQEELQENLLEFQDKKESQETSIPIEFYEKYSIIGNGENKVNIVKSIGINEAFERAKIDCEQAVIEKAKQTVQSQHLVNESPVKTR